MKTFLIYWIDNRVSEFRARSLESAKRHFNTCAAFVEKIVEKK